jgi:putative SOS response-associated peptidase YedK
MGFYHPAVIERYEKWLDPDVQDYEAIREILIPFEAAKMREYPVNPKLNSVNNKDMSLAGPVEASEPKQQGLF